MIDRHEKLLIYRKFPDLRACLIVAQDPARVERHWRDEAGDWQSEEVEQGAVAVPCPMMDLLLEEVYRGGARAERAPLVIGTSRD